MNRSITTILTILLLVNASYAATIYVDAVNGDDGWPGTAAQPKQSISAAIAIAVDYDEIIVNSGTYTGPNNRNLQPGSKKISIKSATGKYSTVIDAEFADRVFWIASAPAEAKIQGFTIQHGYNDTLLTYGGGGGGIYIQQSALTVQDCIIKDCNAVEGSAMLIRNSDGTKIVDCTLENNIAYHSYMAAKAAGVRLYLSENVEFTGCRFIANQVMPPTYHGGAVYLYRYDAAFKNCLFEGNFANRSGGAVYAEEGDLTFDNCTFAGNSCGGNGGVFFIGYMGAPQVDVSNCIFRDNSADGDGDDVFVLGVGTAGGTFRYAYSDINPFNIREGGNGGTTVADLGGNFHQDPYFVTVGQWSGGTWTKGDYHLQSRVGRFNSITGGWTVDDLHSPCIDAGDPCTPVLDEPTPNGDAINGGFYGGTSEASKSPYCAQQFDADLNDDCRVNFVDLAILSEQWLSCGMEPEEFCW